jgi:hypothetical protein
MTTVSTQQVLDYILEQISKEFNINHSTLVEKYGSIDTISNAILSNKIIKKKIIRKVTKELEEPKVEVVAQVAETPKKKVVRKVAKKAEPVTEVPVTEVPITEVPVTEVPVTEVPVTEVPKVEVVTPKKKVVRKVAKKAEPVTEVPVTEVPVTEVVSNTHDKNTEEKVKPTPKSTVKKTPVATKEPELASTPKGVAINCNDLETKEESTNNKSETHLEVSTESVDCHEIEEDVYTDTHTYNDEDSDSLEIRKINGVEYYIDSFNLVYHIETKDCIGKLNNEGNNIMFLNNF